MSENPFVNRLGDALEEAFAADRARKRRRGVWWRRPKVLVALAAVAVGCAAAAGSTLLSSSTLALHPVECVAGTTLDGEIAFPENSAASPVTICAKALNVPAASLIACAGGPHSYVSVFYAAGAGQCRRLGLQPLPPSYAKAQANVAELTRRLVALQAGAYCIPPATFAARARRILDRLGWTGWQVHAGATVEEEAQVIGGGECAVLPGAAYPLFRPDVMSALDPDHNVLEFDLGPPPTLTRLVQTLAVSLEHQSAGRCWSADELKAHVRGRLAAHGLEAAFAFRAEAPGETFNYGGQSSYERGCPVVALLRTAAGNSRRLVDVLVWQRGAAASPSHGLPPQEAFK